MFCLWRVHAGERVSNSCFAVGRKVKFRSLRTEMDGVGCIPANRLDPYALNTCAPTPHSRNAGEFSHSALHTVQMCVEKTIPNLSSSPKNRTLPHPQSPRPTPALVANQRKHNNQPIDKTGDRIPPPACRRSAHTWHDCQLGLRYARTPRERRSGSPSA